MKKFFITLFLSLSIYLCLPSLQAAAVSYEPLSKSEKEQICNRLKATTQTHSEKTDGLGGGVIPDEVLVSIYNTTKNISDSIFLVSILGDTLMCHSLHAAKQRVKIFGVELFSYPNIPIWLCGATIYLFGFMMVLSITFYVVDISFKLGLAIVLMPIGVALWPFGTKIKDLDILAKLVSIFLKSAGIFAFLAITVSFTLGMVSEGLGGLFDLFQAVVKNDTDYVGERFTLSASTFLIVVAALVYGMKLIGSTIPDYVDKFFPDKAFGSASPMHHMATQAMDFVKKKAVQPAAKLAHDIAKTQAGKGLEKAGKAMRGGYHQQFMTAVRNPKQTVKKAGLAVADKAASVAGGVTKTANNLRFGAGIAAASLVAGKANRDQIREKLRNKRDGQNQKIDNALHGKIHEAQDNVNQKIKDNEQQRADKKEQKREERRATDPKYRARQIHKALQTQKRDAKRENRLAKMGAMSQRMSDIDDRKEKATIKTEEIYGAMDNFADKIKKGKPTARLLRGINKLQEKAYKSIDKGKFAKNDNDKWYKKAGKAVIRGSLKLGTDTLALAPKIPLGIVSGAGNAVVNTVNTAAKLVTGSVAGGIVNSAIRGYYNVQKISPAVQKAWYSVPNTLSKVKNIWKAPGVILESVGQAMQDNRPMKNKK